MVSLAFGLGFVFLSSSKKVFKHVKVLTEHSMWESLIPYPIAPVDIPGVSRRLYCLQRPANWAPYFQRIVLQFGSCKQLFILFLL